MYFPKFRMIDLVYKNYFISSYVRVFLGKFTGTGSPYCCALITCLRDLLTIDRTKTKYRNQK